MIYEKIHTFTTILFNQKKCVKTCNSGFADIWKICGGQFTLEINNESSFGKQLIKNAFMLVCVRISTAIICGTCTFCSLFLLHTHYKLNKLH